MLPMLIAQSSENHNLYIIMIIALSKLTTVATICILSSVYFRPMSPSPFLPPPCFLLVVIVVVLYLML